MISDSLELQLNVSKRLEVLYRKHHDWLRSVSYNLCKDSDISDDLIQELYLYLGEKQNPKLFFLDSFNLKYCHMFLSSRWTNLIKRESKNSYPDKFKDSEDTPYDEEWDNELQRFEEDVKQEINRLKTTSMWSSAQLYEMYQFSDKTMEELSNDIKISKSTTFLNVKKIKQHLQEVITKPTRNVY
tara:strand:+ start:354 stop:908 length:555 start_codon:yes stop_codon:yes gene_type:complete